MANRLDKKRNPFKSSNPKKALQGQSTLPFLFNRSQSTLSDDSPKALTNSSLAKLNRSASNLDFFAVKSRLSSFKSNSFDDVEEVDDGEGNSTSPVNLKNSMPVGSFLKKTITSSPADDVNTSVASASSISISSVTSTATTPNTKTSKLKLTVSPPEKNTISTYSLNKSESSSKIQSTFNLGKKEPTKRTAPWETNRRVTKKMKNPRIKEQNSRNTFTDWKPTDLSPEQKRVIDLVLSERKSVFYTGSAGTGKSYLLKELIYRLQRKYATGVAVTASTGLAAVNIGGTTINRFSGCGIAKEPAPVLVKRVLKNAGAKNRWQTTKVLIIDEVSMIDALFFDKLDYVAKHVRRNGNPFGGIQLVVTGDFFQLPPVASKNQKAPEFCFQARSWKSCIDKTILLQKVFRQKDQDFVDLLNGLRIGEVTDEMCDSFKALSRDVHYADGIQPTELFCTRYEVDQSNSRRLASLDSETFVFEAYDSGPDIYKSLLENTMAVKILYLKEGAQVMMLKNIDNTIVNGSVGRIICFLTENMLAKAQAVLKDPGLQSVASQSFCRMLSACIGKTEISNEVLRYANMIPNKSEFIELASLALQESRLLIYPVVNFSTNEGQRIMLVERQEFLPDGLAGDSQSVVRSQLPLLLSWALSIHKSQGQTLDRVKVDLRRVFEAGQVYVALSRAVSKDRLQIINFDRSKIKSSSVVKEFYTSLETMPAE